MQTTAVVLEAPGQLALRRIELSAMGDEDVVVDIEWSGISTGTERLLYTGTMPNFPGMGYPLVPGYESVGRISAVGAHATRALGERVFVPGARCFGEIRGLFGGAASRLVVAATRATPIGDHGGEDSILLALAATAYHALAAPGAAPADLIVGHGVLGRLLARIAIALGGPAPTVWELNAERAQGAIGYQVINPTNDLRKDYRAIYDVSGDSKILDSLIGRLGAGGEVVLAGFYNEPLSFLFAPAFIREARLRVAAEWKEADLLATRKLVDSGALSLAGLITHRTAAVNASDAYKVAFEDPRCLKMVLDWRAIEA